MSIKRVLITGSEGQLGTSMLKQKNEFELLELIPTDLRELDITNKAEVISYLSGKPIDYIVNCAAYTAVDKAEQFETNAFAVNHIGPKNLANVCKTLKIPLIHISTDYVFSGQNYLPYKEIDPTRPLTSYGRSKLAGENSILDSGVHGIIIRTSWLYSEYGSNFIKSMIRLGHERKEIGVVFDQIGSPTYAKDLALAILEILKGFAAGTIMLEASKIYHYCNQGVCSWYDLAQAVMDINNINCLVRPITTKEFPLPAKRPHYSVLNTEKFRNKFDIEIPYWRNSLSHCIDLLKL